MENERGTASMRYPYDADADGNGDILVHSIIGMELKNLSTVLGQLIQVLVIEVYLEKVLQDMKEFKLQNLILI